MTELKIYFLHQLKVDHQAAIDLFTQPVVIQSDAPRWTELEDFITRLHEKEVFDGDVRQTLFRVIFTIDEMDLLEPDPSHHQRNNKPVPIKEHLVHCRCGSHFDETILVQCYACQVSRTMLEDD